MNTKKKEFKVFDPNPSIKLALKIFMDIGITQFALIGKLAMWTHLEDESQHGYTKDVDFAVFLKEAAKIEKEVTKKNITYKYLNIGGIGIRENGLSIDFIDRRLNGVDLLFAEAIESASLEAYVGDTAIPVVSLEHLVAMKMVSGEPKDDTDLKILLILKDLNYQKAKQIVEKYLGAITAERLDVFAREVGILPKRGPYIYGR